MTASRSVEVRIPLRWADMDAYGHVNNIAVVQLLEEARVAAFGVPANTGAGGGQAPPIDLLEGEGSALVRRSSVGVLLGQDNGKTINVANSFAVPFEEDERDGKTWFLDHDYIEGMMEMFKKVNGTWSALTQRAKR